MPIAPNVSNYAAKARTSQPEKRIVNPVLNRVEQPEPDPAPTPPADMRIRQPRRYLPVVDYRATICPNCGSAETSIHRTERYTDESIRRIHDCGCGAVFSSMHTIPLVDRESFKAASKPQGMTVKA